MTPPAPPSPLTQCINCGEGLFKQASYEFAEGEVGPLCKQCFDVVEQAFKSAAVNTHATLQARIVDLVARLAARTHLEKDTQERAEQAEAQVETLTTQLAERSRQREAAVAALRRLEFTKVIVGADTCPACGWGKPHGHSKSHCWLRDVLESVEGAVTP